MTGDAIYYARRETARSGKCTKCGALASDGWATCRRDGYCPAPTPSIWHWGKKRRPSTGNTADRDQSTCGASDAAPAEREGSREAPNPPPEGSREEGQ